MRKRVQISDQSYDRDAAASGLSSTIWCCDDMRVSIQVTVEQMSVLQGIDHRHLARNNFEWWKGQKR